MYNNKVKNTNPWNNIPLSDYEAHMSHSTVGQLKLLNGLTKKYLDLIKPTASMFLGIAGGNGLEHVDSNTNKKVIGIDINPDYLDTASKRYLEKIVSLRLIHLDITKNSNTVQRVDFIWAALILEYTGIESSLEFSRNNLLPGGHLVVTIQSNNNLPAISATGIESLKQADEIFKPVNPETLLTMTNQIGYILISKEENSLPNGKSFITFHFQLLAN